MAEVRAIFDKVLSLPNVGLFEITEFNPTLDNDEDKHQHIYELFGYALQLLKKSLIILMGQINHLPYGVGGFCYWKIYAKTRTGI